MEMSDNVEKIPFMSEPKETTNQPQPSSSQSSSQQPRDLFQTMNSFFKILDEKAVEFSKSPVVEQMANEITRFSKQFNQDTNENIEILKNDLSSNLYSMTHYWNLHQKNIDLTASELREQTIQELYKQIKSDVLKNRILCQSSTEIKTTSSKIALGIKNKLESEGFDVEMEIKEDHTLVSLKW